MHGDLPRATTFCSVARQVAAAPGSTGRASTLCHRSRLRSAPASTCCQGCRCRGENTRAADAEETGRSGEARASFYHLPDIATGRQQCRTARPPASLGRDRKARRPTRMRSPQGAAWLAGSRRQQEEYGVVDPVDLCSAHPFRHRLGACTSGGQLRTAICMPLSMTASTAAGSLPMRRLPL